MQVAWLHGDRAASAKWMIPTALLSARCACACSSHGHLNGQRTRANSSAFRWRSRRTALDHGVFHDLVHAGCGNALAPLANGVGQQRDGGAPHRRHRLMHGGEFGPDGGGHKRVVETGHRDVLGHAQPQPVRNRDGGGGHVVVAAKDGGGWLRPGEQAVCSDQAGAVGEQTVGDQFIDNRQPCRLQAVEVATGTQCAGRVVRVALDQGDASRCPSSIRWPTMARAAW